MSGVGFGISDTNSIISGLSPNTEYLITIRAVQGDIQGNPAVIAQSTGNEVNHNNSGPRGLIVLKIP